MCGGLRVFWSSWHNRALPWGRDLQYSQSGLVTTQVPEPGTLALYGTGLLSLAGVIRRLRRSGQ
ncbi:MAG: hypothetical protein DMG23_01235 [Acidobacteria bacterium]|nr:MAG: hypothetical protein DMG23_01235 [Acidobacteriota bacterium]